MGANLGCLCVCHRLAGVAIPSATIGSSVAPQRVFDRAEVLAALSAYKATWDLTTGDARARAADQVFAELRRIFERLE